mmetsp:Transcript_4970/g.7092  ORF Transcript_4970/g.7092 Transcript_4970/m.7092 type:complete len:277 (-) Transcript_4970:179-1009(-)|eukprot:CAMPEP_0195518534 /NCGR_PEP_ID=MMETSP0794_2-20130614/13094_1 /TAXON_ID=515487 /ORGANISM="Stephanopyxis turris, Strain CCMP 815" /LENGTH=276 /DNA_ID=CAMNT_0040647515 /DNA_START=32 /DNA_END=862 /DNA_ORIENTATION=+
MINTITEEENDDEINSSTDLFVPTDSIPTFTLDRESLSRIGNARRGPGPPPSVSATEIASSVGSVVGVPRHAFLKSFTFIKDEDQSEPMNWSIRFATDDSSPTTRRRSRSSSSRKQKLYIESVEGIFALSRIQAGDYLKYINHERVGPSYNVERAIQKMHQCLEDDNFLSITTANKEQNAKDILVQVTILKPESTKNYEDLGLTVWVWGLLCVKSMEKGSIFYHSALKEGDQLVSVNDISCGGMTPRQFAHVMDAFPLEVTITVLRRKHRWTGKFG